MVMEQSKADVYSHIERRLSEKVQALRKAGEVVIERGSLPPPPQGVAISPAHIRDHVVKSLYHSYELHLSMTGGIHYEILWGPHSPGLLDSVWNVIKGLARAVLGFPKVFIDAWRSFLRSFQEFGRSFLSSLLEGVVSLFKGFYQWISEVVGTIRDLFPEWLADAWHRMIDRIAAIATFISDFLGEYWKWLLAVIVLGGVVIVLWLFGPIIWPVLQPVLGPVFGWLGAAGEAIGSFLGEWGGAVISTVTDVFDSLRRFWEDYLEGPVTMLQNVVSAWSPVIELLPDAVQDKLINPITNTMGEVWSLADAAFQRTDLVLSTVSPALHSMREAWEDSFGHYEDLQAEILREEHLADRQNYAAQEELTRSHLDMLLTPTEDGIRYQAQLDAEERLRQTWATLLQDAPTGAGKVQAWFMQKFVWFKDWIASTAETVINGIQYAIAGYKPSTPYLAHANAMQATFFCVGAGAMAHGLATAAEIIHPMKWMGIHYLSAFLAQMGGFGLVASQTMGQLLKRAVGVPYGYALNADYRPYIPRDSMLALMAVKPDIRMEDFKLAMQWWGYRDEWIDAWSATMYHEPRYFELSMMATDESASADWLYRKARRAGYNAVDAEIFAESIVKKSLSRERDDYSQSLTDLYREGFITQEQFDEHLRPLGLREEAHFLLKRAARFQYLKAYIQDMIKYFTDLYTGEVISLDEFNTSLTGLGMSPERVHLTINTARIKLERKAFQEEQSEIEKVIRQEQDLLVRKYLEMYRAGTIEKGSLVSYLISAGTTPGYASVVADIEEQKKLGRERKTELTTVEAEDRRIREQYRKLYELQFAEEKITAQQLRSYLLQLGYSDEEAESMVALAVEKRGGTVPVLREADYEAEMNALRAEYLKEYRSLYRRGLIVEEHLRGWMAAWGFPPEAAQEILDTEREIRRLHG